nr:MAG TPA: hypothetical protein [Caudoviricetes sp.]
MGNEIIFRYLDVGQFIDIVDNLSLFFIHRDQISQYEEGKLPDNIETQIRYWARINHFAILQHQFQQFASDCVLSTYDEENIIQDEIRKTLNFLNLSFFSCWHLSKNFDKNVMQGLGKSIGIKTSKKKLLNSLFKKGIIVQSGKIFYYEDLNRINALKRLNLLFAIPKIFENENEFRILLPLFKSHEIYQYENFPKNQTIRRTKEYLMYKCLLKNIVYDENTHGVRVPFDLRIISEIYMSTEIVNQLHDLLTKNNLLKKIKIYDK